MGSSTLRERVKASTALGATEIEILGRRQPAARQRKSVAMLHDAGARAVLYTGIFGAEDVRARPSLAMYAQRDALGRILGYGGERSAMMCPSSPYTSEVLVPELRSTLDAGFDAVFFDIPWVMRGGCYHCDNDEHLVRDGAASVVDALRETHPDVALGVNASAPTIHNEHPRSHIDELAGLFDEYVTEWNPLRWGQPPSVVGGAIEYASEHGRVLHATTATRKGVVHGRLGELLGEIVAHGATPRLGIDPRRHPELGEALYACR